MTPNTALQEIKGVTRIKQGFFFYLQKPFIILLHLFNPVYVYIHFDCNKINLHNKIIRLLYKAY